MTGDFTVQQVIEYLQDCEPDARVRVFSQSAIRLSDEITMEDYGDYVCLVPVIHVAKGGE